MTNNRCNCRGCIVCRRAEAYGLDDDNLLPSQEELTDLPDDLGDCGEPELEPLADD